MAVPVSSIACHTCGASASDLDQSEFVCANCGTRNFLTERVQCFFARHQRFFEGPVEVTRPLGGFVHALERIRGYSTQQIHELTGSLVPSRHFGKGFPSLDKREANV